MFVETSNPFPTFHELRIGTNFQFQNSPTFPKKFQISLTFYEKKKQKIILEKQVFQ